MRNANKAKAVRYAYQTSTNAKLTGFYRTGCYTVEIGTQSKPNFKPLKGFNTLKEAQTYAETLSLPYAICAGKPENGDYFKR